MSPNTKKVIAHRGASGYLPEHSLTAKAYAHALGADYVEQDIALTRDRVPIVIHDLYLDCISNVADVFPTRSRDDGHYYAIDFNWAEIKTLTAHDRTNPQTGKSQFPGRYGLRNIGADIHTLAEEIEFIQGLNKSTGRNVGFYMEVKNPLFHKKAGMDIGKAIIKILEDYDLNKENSPCLVFCFESSVLKHMRFDLGCRTQMSQLIGEPGTEDDPTDDFEFYETSEGLKEITSYAQAISPPILELLRLKADGTPEILPLAQKAKSVNLQIYPYTLRRDTLPQGVDEESVLNLLFSVTNIDGIITDFPDTSVSFLERNNLR
jgi:glycerophosphoryl diester phosphodiesterase